MPAELDVTFAGIVAGRTPFDANKPRSIAMGRDGDVWRLLYVADDRYLLFMGEVPVAPGDGETPPRHFASKLTAADDGKVVRIDGRKLTVAAHGGTGEVG